MAGELERALGQGRQYTSRGKVFEVTPAPIKVLKKAMELRSKIPMPLAYAYHLNLSDSKTINTDQMEKDIVALLKMATGNQYKQEELNEIDVETAEEMIEFFLFGKRADQRQGQ